MQTCSNFEERTYLFNWFLTKKDQMKNKARQRLRKKDRLEMMRMPGDYCRDREARSYLIKVIKVIKS